jgi:hypothetical protein
MSNFNDDDNYVAGRRDEQIRRQENAGTQGLLIGLLIVLGVGGIAAALFFSNRSDTTVVPVAAPSASPASPSPVQNRETIIREKSTEVVPVPASPAAQPNINITVPSEQPSPVTQPSAAVQPSASVQPSSAASPPVSTPSASPSASP